MLRCRLYNYINIHDMTSPWNDKKTMNEKVSGIWWVASVTSFENGWSRDSQNCCCTFWHSSMYNLWIALRRSWAFSPGRGGGQNQTMNEKVSDIRWVTSVTSFENGWSRDSQNCFWTFWYSSIIYELWSPRRSSAFSSGRGGGQNQTIFRAKPRRRT